MRLDSVVDADGERRSPTHVDAVRSPSPSVPPPGTARFAPGERASETERELRARRFLWVGAPTSAPPQRGLRTALDGAVELALAMRGALPARVEAGAALGAVIADQVFRARALGASGLAVAMPRLPCGAQGELDPEDSAVLVAWLAAAREEPIALVFADADRLVRVLSPVPLAELVGRAATTMPATATAIAALVASDLGAALGAAAGRVDIEESRSCAASPSSDPPPAPDTLLAPSAQPRAESRPRGVLLPRSSSKPRRPDAPAVAAQARPVEVVAAKHDAAADAEAMASANAVPTAVAESAASEPDGPPVTRQELRRTSNRRILGAAEWRSLAVELDNARGPKPVRVIEQLFATHYTPLLGATLAGETDAAVRGVVDAWRTSFEHSYREAYSALRVTGKRPPMVFDAPDIAGRLARLNGARGVKLLLVDAMRFDLGERVAARLKDAVADRAILVERSLLWAALPTTTTAQMALLGRGAEGLRDAPPPSEAEPAIARGRAVATLRRERAGARELMKLDLVEARLRAAGPPFAERLEMIADEVAEVIARFIETLPPRTLLLVFGDHGFRMTPMADGSVTGPATQGGGSPEEVLMPAQAWLVGGVH